MKILIYILLVISILLFLLSCFIWFIYHGSGHIIPVETEQKILFFIIVLILITAFLIIMKFKVKK